MFLPLINKPTRITAYSATLIDNNFTNHLTQNLFSVIMINDLSDHLPVFVYIFKENFPLCKRPAKTIIRDFCDVNIAKFRSYLSDANWANLSNPDPNNMFNAFLNKFSSLYELSFPPKTVKAKKSGRPLTPWMTKGLLLCVRKKNKFYKKFIISRSLERKPI